MTTFQNIRQLTDHGNQTARKELLQVADAALDRVHPRHSVPNAVCYNGNMLHIGDRSIDFTEADDIYVVGAGKGSVAIVEEIERILGNIISAGIVAEKTGQTRDLNYVDVLGAGHPYPDETSVEAGRRVLDLVDSAGEDDLVFACITGGASAQLVAPADGLSLNDIRETTRVLLSAGLAIDEINTVRKHLSELKGGLLAERSSPATVVTLVIVDEVAGKPWGPTIADETTFRDAINILERRSLTESVPRPVRAHLEYGTENENVETIDSNRILSLDTEEVVLAEAADACEAARDRALELGYEPLIISTSIEGESSEIAKAIAGIAREADMYGRPVEPPCILITGGETTVALSGDVGVGGPNQEFSLQFATEIDSVESVTALAIGTDGTDGPTDIAGGLVDGTTTRRLRSRDISPFDHLGQHNASEPLRAVSDAVYTGATDTNVMDLRLVAVR
jgi:glycerate-2-kinase